MSTPQVCKALVYNPDGKILTLFRSATHPHLAHYVDFPGGEVEGNEKPEVAIAREIGKTTLPNTPKVHLSWEHERYEWLSAEELLKQMADQTKETDTFWGYVIDHLGNPS